MEFNTSQTVTRTFCGTCGSPLTYQTVTEPTLVDIMTVSLDDPAACPPTYRVWVSQKVEWDVIADDLPCYPQAR